MGTDPFEEFEFKPLTEGLGFHQKETPKPAVTPALKPQLQKGLDFMETPAESNTPLTAPLPRRELRKEPAATPAPVISPVDDILNNLQKNRKMEIELDRKHRQELRQSQKRTETWKTSSPKFSPMLLDSMLITAASLLCLIIMLIVTRVDLITNLSNPDTGGLIYLSTMALFAGVAFIYTVVHRVFLGFTPGEWAYDLRVGRPEQQGQAVFALKVIARQILITFTGMFLLPLIGWILGRDLAGSLTGLSLHRKV